MSKFKKAITQGVSRKQVLFFHFLFWFLYLTFSLLHFYFGGRPSSTYCLTANYIIDIVTIYLLISYVIPVYLLHKSITSFFLVCFSILIGNIFLNFVILNFVINDFIYDIGIIFERQAFNLQHSMPFIFIASGVKIYFLSLSSVTTISKLEKEKVQSELEYLKLQMNPHFLFNTLNNIYIQTKVDKDKAAQAILMLSDLLRYQIYECSNEKVFLKNDIEYISNYLDLQKERFSEIDIKIEIEGSIAAVMVYPFIFLTFVENAVKHGISDNSKNSYIYLKFKKNENKLQFTIDNSKIISKLQKNSNSSGIGLKNVKRRLDLLYPNSHKLEIKESETKYFVKLEINLI